MEAGPIAADDSDLNECLGHVKRGDVPEAKISITVMKNLGLTGHEKCQQALDNLNIANAPTIVERLAAKDGELKQCLEYLKQGEVDKAERQLKRFSSREDIGYLTCRAEIYRFENKTSEIYLSYAFRKKLNNYVVDLEVLVACERLYAEDETAAMTNSVCVEAFRRWEHPSTAEAYGSHMQQKPTF